MSAYLISIVTARRLEWLAEYQEHVPRIIHRHGGKYLALPKQVPNAVELVEGTASTPDSIVIFSFPSMEAIKAFLNDPEYAPYKQARIAATESNLFAFQNDDGAPQLLGR